MWEAMRSYEYVVTVPILGLLFIRLYLGMKSEFRVINSQLSDRIQALKESEVPYLYPHYDYRWDDVVYLQKKYFNRYFNTLVYCMCTFLGGLLLAWTFTFLQVFEMKRTGAMFPTLDSIFASLILTALMFVAEIIVLVSTAGKFEVGDPGGMLGHKDNDHSFYFWVFGIGAGIIYFAGLVNFVALLALGAALYSIPYSWIWYGARTYGGVAKYWISRRLLCSV